MGKYVNAVARTTDTKEIPPHKQSTSYQYDENMSGFVRLMTQPSIEVRPLQVEECPIQIEAEPVSPNEMGRPEWSTAAYVLKVKTLKVHAEIVSGSLDRTFMEISSSGSLMLFHASYLVTNDGI